jgi:hypothetical protein
VITFFGIFLEFTEVAQNPEVLFPYDKLCRYVDIKQAGLHIGRFFFTNSSGHPACSVRLLFAKILFPEEPFFVIMWESDIYAKLRPNDILPKREKACVGKKSLAIS